MNKIKHFLIDLIISILICLPCLFVFRWIHEMWNIDWLDVLLIMSGISVVSLAANLILAKSRKSKKIFPVTKLAITSTVMYICYAIVEFILPISSDSAGINWEQWVTLSITMSVFFHIQEKRRLKN